MDGSAGDGRPAAHRVRFGLTFRTVLGTVLLGVVIMGGFAALTVGVSALRSAARSAVRSVQALSTANRLERSVLDLQTGLRGYLITSQTTFLEPYYAALADYPRLVRQLDLLLRGHPGLRRELTAIDVAIGSYVRDSVQPLIAAQRAGRVTATSRTVASGEGKRRVDALRARFAALTAGETRIFTAEVANADRIGGIAVGLGIAGIVVSGLGTLIASVGIDHAVVRPLRRLAAATGRLSAGDLSARVPPRGQAEVGDLNRGFNTMAASMEHGRDTLEAQRADLAEALAIAGQQKEHSDLLRRFGDRLAVASSVEAVTATALHDMADTAGAEIGAVYLAEDGSGRYHATAVRGLPPAAARARLAAGEGLAGRAVAERRPVQASAGQGGLRMAGLAGSCPAARELHLPLRHGERTVGVVSLGRARDEPFTDQDLAVLGDLAGQAAVACAEALSLVRVEQTAHQLETLLASTDEGIYLVTRDGMGTLVNEAALRQTGYRREELVGRRLHDVIHHSHADGTPYPADECPVQQVFRTGHGIRVSDETLWRKDGSWFPAEYSAYPLIEGEEVTGVAVTFIDVTSRQRTEAQRDTQHAVTRVIAAAALDDDRIWDRALAAACEGLGLPVGLGWIPVRRGTRLRCVASYAAPGLADLAARLGEAELPAGEGPAGLCLARRELVLLRDLEREPPRAGMLTDRRLRSAMAIPALDGQGRVLAIAEFFGGRDLAEEGLASTLTSLAGQIAQYIERMRTEAETQRIREEFVSTVSHELRTPLTSIAGWLHILLGGEPGPLTGEQRHFLEIIRNNSDRLMRQVGDLLLAGQIESGRFSLELAGVDLAALARSAVELVSAQAAGKKITVGLDAPAPAVVHGDRARLLQVLDNLLSNAVKYTPDGGQVRIGVAARDGTCRVTVSDTGIGIPPQDRPRLFQRFYRASSATERGITGTGLGLAITRAVVEAHHGSIRLAEHAGPGSVFVVELPLAAREEAAQ